MILWPGMIADVLAAGTAGEVLPSSDCTEVESAVAAYRVPRSPFAQALHLAKKSREPIEVQQYNDSRQEEKIGRKIENMQLMDSVSYATFTVAFSQPGQVYTQIIVNAAYVTATPFMLQCKAALNNGWDIVKAIAVAFLTIWPLLLVAALALLAYKIVVRRPLLLAKK